MNEELRKLSPFTQNALEQWVASDLEKLPFQYDLLKQVAPNSHINVYRISAPEGKLFTKVYLDKPEVAEEERQHYEFFKDLSFVPALLHTVFPSASQKRLLSYQYIENDDLHRQFTAARKAGSYVDRSIVHESLVEIHQMGETIQDRTDVPLPQTPWPIKSPIRTGFISPNIESEFLNDYYPVFNSNQEAMVLFPGFYFDRNPRNIMRDSKKIWQVDFGVIERSSLIFDLAKLLRNGTDINLSADSNLTDPELWRELSAYPIDAEEEFIDSAYRIATNEKPTIVQSRDKFASLYDFATVHSHFFYLTKYGKMYREQTGDSNKLLSRFVYHLGGLQYTFDKLDQIGENTAKLRNWGNKFTNLVFS